MKRPCNIVACMLSVVFTSAQVTAHPGATDAAGCHEDTRTHKRHCHRKAAAQLPEVDGEGMFTGAVTWVNDGDTLRVLVRGRAMDVRIAEVDAPERDQPYGWQAKLALIDLVRNREVSIAPYDVDRYGRVIAHVYVGESNVAAELVRAGAAWFYTEYANDAHLYDLEQQARRSRRGLWALPAQQRLEPWQWRRASREADATNSVDPTPGK